MKRKINLLHTVLCMGIGGLERLVAETALVMNRDLFNIEVCCFDQLGQFAELLQNNGIEVTLLQKNQEHFDLFYPLRLVQFLRGKKIDILQMHSGTFFFGSIAGWLAGTPVTVYTDHGRFLVEPKIRAVEDCISGILVDRIVAVSEELKESLIAKTRLPSRKICTVINGIRVSEFSRRPKPMRLKEEFQISESCRVIGTVGRLDDIKDQLSIIKGFELVRSKVPEIKLLLVGEGPLRPKLSEYIARQQLGNSVTITGERRDVSDFLNLFDVFVLSSLSEGTSIALLEAMASGLPSVVTDVGGNPSIIDDNLNGFLIKPRDILEMAEKISILLKDDVIYERFSNNAITKVREEFSIERMVEKYTGIYLQLLKKKKKYRDIESLLRQR